MKEKMNGIEFERSSGNVFADLGLPRPEDRLIKSKLTALITKEISQRGLAQSEVGELVGIDQADWAMRPRFWSCMESVKLSEPNFFSAISSERLNRGSARA